MNMQTIFIRAAIAAVFFGGYIAVSHTAHAQASTMSLEARAPLHATLLPVVTVVASAAQADASQFRVAAGESLPVTLLPTVYVTARAAEFADVVHEVVDTRLAQAD